MGGLPGIEPDSLKWIAVDEPDDTGSDAVRLSRLELFRLRALSSAPVHIRGERKRRALLESILALKPFKPFPVPKGMITPLRSYQQEGMAFMASLREQKKVKAPFLVVSPTTVLSHWERKLSQHAPGLKALLDLTVPGYLGNDRHFSSRYLEPVQKNLEHSRTEELRRKTRLRTGSTESASAGGSKFSSW